MADIKSLNTKVDSLIQLVNTLNARVNEVDAHVKEIQTKMTNEFISIKSGIETGHKTALASMNESLQRSEDHRTADNIARMKEHETIIYRIDNLVVPSTKRAPTKKPDAEVATVDGPKIESATPGLKSTDDPAKATSGKIWFVRHIIQRTDLYKKYWDSDQMRQIEAACAKTGTAKNTAVANELWEGIPKPDRLVISKDWQESKKANNATPK